MDADPALELVGIRKAFGRRELWPTPVDLSVAPGETVALMGPNGSGKSTLLRIAATHLRPTSGHVKVLGVDARRSPEQARRALGFLHQEAPAYAELTPHEHVVWWLRLHDDGPRTLDAGERAASALQRAGLGLVAHRKAATLSRGQRQRLGLVLATVHEPAVLLLDEPATALDEAGAAWLRATLDARAGTAATLVALHDASEAGRLRARVVQLGRRA